MNCHSQAVFAVTMGLFGCMPLAGRAQSSGQTLPVVETMASAHVPVKVLDGTRLTDLQAFASTTLPKPLGGTYRVEQGGAALMLSISRDSDGGWIVQRRFQEPGQTPATKRYAVYRHGKELVSDHHGIVIRGADGGLVVLERHSGVASIPSSYWIRYNRTNQAGSTPWVSGKPLRCCARPGQ